MMTKTTPDVYEDITLRDVPIDGAWSYTETDKENTEKTVQALLMIVLILAFLLATRPAVALLGEVWGVIADVAVGLAVFFSIPRISRKFSSAKEKKRDAVRRLHAPAVLAALREQGWKLVRSEDAVETLVTDNNPYLLNADGVRYYTKFIDIYPNEVRFLLRLSDPKVEAEMAEAEKEKRIGYLTRLHETTHGVMTDDQKEAFVAALRLSL